MWKSLSSYGRESYGLSVGTLMDRLRQMLMPRIVLVGAFRHLSPRYLQPLEIELLQSHSGGVETHTRVFANQPEECLPLFFSGPVLVFIGEMFQHLDLLPFTTVAERLPMKTPVKRWLTFLKNHR